MEEIERDTHRDTEDQGSVEEGEMISFEQKASKRKEKRNLKTALLWHAWEASTYACAGEANRKLWRIKLRVYNTNTLF